MPRRFPKHLPVWIPTLEGIQETVSPFRSVGAAVLARYNTGESWAKVRHVADRAAFMHAWHLWCLNRLRRLEASAAATRELEAIREQVGISDAPRPKIGAGVSPAPRAKMKTARTGIRAHKRTKTPG